MPEPPADPTRSATTTIAESAQWIEALRASGPRYQEACRRLHGLLLRAARYEIARRRSQLPHLRGDDYDDLAQQSADDALVALLGKLDDFRGESRFTTWAYKFALLEAAVKVRKRAWQGREVPLDPDGWRRISDAGPTPAADLEERELLGAISDAIGAHLTAHQRSVLVAIVLNDVPIDVLAERLGTTRGALYKTVHDARRKLRARLDEIGLGRERDAEGGRR